jgi:hypothetical protein
VRGFGYKIVSGLINSIPAHDGNLPMRTRLADGFVG